MSIVLHISNARMTDPKNRVLQILFHDSYRLFRFIKPDRFFLAFVGIITDRLQTINLQEIVIQNKEIQI